MSLMPWSRSRPVLGVRGTLSSLLSSWENNLLSFALTPTTKASMRLCNPGRSGHVPPPAGGSEPTADSSWDVESISDLAPST